MLRFHRNKYPVPGELVIGKNVKITELGVYVRLLEYGGIEGLVVIGELSKKRIRNIQKLIKLNKLEVLSVLRVDKEKGYIDLSRKKVVESDYNDTYRKYTKNKIGHNIIVSLGQKIGIDPLELYENWGWDKAESYNSLYEYFGNILEAYNYENGRKEEIIREEDDENSIGKEMQNSTKTPKYKLSLLLQDVPLEIQNNLIEQISSKYNAQKVKIRADIDLTCYGQDGIQAIKKSLLSAYDYNNELIISLVKPPTYSITLISDNHTKGKEILKECLVHVKNKMNTFKGGCYEEVSLKVYGLKERKIDEEEVSQEE